MNIPVKAKKFRKKGQKYLSKGNAERAFLYFEKALMLSQEPADRFNIALALLNLNRYSEAERYLEKLYHEYPDNEINALSYGDTLMMQNKWDIAEKVFVQLVKKKPEKASYKQYLAKSRDVVEREKYVTSRKLITKGLQAIDNKDFSTAYDLYKKAEIIDPENPTILTNLGSLLLRKKNYFEAHKYLNKALKRAPDNILIQKNLKRVQRRIRSGRK